MRRAWIIRYGNFIIIAITALALALLLNWEQAVLLESEIRDAKIIGKDRTALTVDLKVNNIADLSIDDQVEINFNRVGQTVIRKGRVISIYKTRTDPHVLVLIVSAGSRTIRPEDFYKGVLTYRSKYTLAEKL